MIVDEMGHVPDANSNLECLDRIMLDFFAAPMASLEWGCVHDMRTPPFEVPTDIELSRPGRSTMDVNRKCYGCVGEP